MLRVSPLILMLACGMLRRKKQSMQILKRAATVKDMLDISETLGYVRGQMEQLQGHNQVPDNTDRVLRFFRPEVQTENKLATALRVFPS